MMVSDIRGLRATSGSNRTAVNSTGEEADGAAGESTGCLKSLGRGKGKT